MKPKPDFSYLPPEDQQLLRELALLFQQRKKESRKLGRQVRKLLIEIQKGQCWACRTAHPSILEIHHADPVGELAVPDPAKLFALCPNCHAYAHLLRRARDKPERREALTAELLNAHQESVAVVERLLFIADTQSTAERIREEVARRTQERDES